MFIREHENFAMTQSDEMRTRFKASLWDGCRYGEDAQSSRNQQNDRRVHYESVQ